MNPHSANRAGAIRSGLLFTLLIVVWCGCVEVMAANALPAYDYSNNTELPRQPAEAWRLSAYIGEVKSSSPPGTVASPPFSTVEIISTLRGEALFGNHELFWTTGVTGMADEEEGCSSRPYDAHHPCKLVLDKSSLARVVVPPTASSKILFFVEPRNQDGKFGVLMSAIPGLAARIQEKRALITTHVFPATALSLGIYKKYEKQTEPFNQRFSGTLLLSVVFCSIAALGTALSLPKIAIGLAVVSLLTYQIYESGISVQTNIRVDLLVIYPLQALAFAAILIALYRIANQKPKS
jgi:hypothetical protein